MKYHLFPREPGARVNLVTPAPFLAVCHENARNRIALAVKSSLSIPIITYYKAPCKLL